MGHLLCIWNCTRHRLIVCSVLVCTAKENVWRKVFCAWFQPGRPCSCKTNSLSLMGGSGAGWEGTAILHHGSYIRVGCLQFVFSIVDQASQELLPPPRVKPPEQMSLLKTHLKAAQWYLPPPPPPPLFLLFVNFVMKRCSLLSGLRQQLSVFRDRVIHWAAQVDWGVGIRCVKKGWTGFVRINRLIETIFMGLMLNAVARFLVLLSVCLHLNIYIFCWGILYL